MPAQVEAYMENAEYIRLVSGEELSPRQYQILLRALGSPADIVRSAAKDISVILGISQKRAETIVSAWASLDTDRIAAQLAERNIDIITIESGSYPHNLRFIPDPPPVLFCRGSLEERDAVAISVVGTRKPSAYGCTAARKISADLARQGITIISGLAAGIDCIAHKAALEAEGRTIAVTGCGLDRCYPAQHYALMNAIASRGAVLSEFPVGSFPSRHHFPQRNRIISGLSLGTLVIEAGEKSGALITAHLALEQGREVYALPGPVYCETSKGTNTLIREGATIVTGYQDVLEEIAYISHYLNRMRRTPQTLPQKSCNNEEEEKVLSALSESEAKTIDEIEITTHLPMTRIHKILIALQMTGNITQFSGQRYLRHVPNP